MKTRVFLFTAALLLFAIDLKASVGDVFKVGDLWYYVVDQPFLEGGAVEVCKAQNGETYAGEIVIPDMIELNNGALTFGVVEIGSEAFKGCSDLTIHVPGSVKRIVPNAFSNCSGITLVIDDLSSWCKMECGVWRSSSRFYEDEPFMPWVDWLVVDGKKLTSLEVPADVTTLGNVFRGYRNLESVNLPASVSLGSKSFQGCTGLRSVYVHREAPYPINSILFENVGRSCTLYVPKGLREDFIECGWTENVFLGGVVETDEVPVPTGVGITKLRFPDKELRSYLRSMEEGQDGIFTEEEIASIKRFNPTNKKIESLEGIGAFTSLEELICYENNLSRLDLPKNLPLKRLDVSSCPLQSIDVSAYSSLEVLKCSDCGLSSLDVSKNPNLKLLSCNKNQLTSLDLSKNPNLTALSCSENELTSLDLSNNPLLGDLRCEENELTSLDLSHCPEMSWLYCHNNRLMELNIDGCSKLNYIFCYNNQLTRLDVSQCAILWELYCSNNAITSLDFPRAKELRRMECSWNPVKRLDLSNCISLEYLWCNDCQLTELLLPLSPIETIECANNQLEQLDASGNRRLYNLLCDHNQLKSINVSGCDRLGRLRCNNNLMKDDGMDKLIAGLPLKDFWPYFDVINEAGDGNRLTSAQLQAIRDKGWTPRKCNSDMSGWTTIIDINDMTAIASPELQQEVQHGVIYNLQGQRRMSLQKGLNVVDGKKIMK